MNPPLTMNQQLNQVFPKDVLALMSDASVDFKLKANQSQLNQQQKEALNQIVGCALPDVININQVHGREIVVIKDRPIDQYQMQDADGIITNVKNIPIAIRTADCVPVFLYDQMTQCIGLIHAGWKSTQQQIVKAAITIMQRDFQSQPQNIKAYLGPCIRVDSFEVGPEFLDYLPKEVVKKNDSYYCDVALANYNQLLSCGVLAEHIVDSKECTFSNPKYYSFRRDADQAGRMIHLMMLKNV